MTFITDAIVLKKRPWRDSDALYTLFTKERGKMHAVGKGVKKIKSKMAGHLEPMSLTTIMIAKSRGVDKVAGGNLVKEYRGMKEDFFKAILAARVAEIIDQMTREEMRDDRIFSLLKRCFEILELRFTVPEERKHARSFLCVFSLQFLDALGYTPELYACIRCKKPFEKESALFSARHGGIVCSACAEERDETQAIGAEALSYLRLMLIGDLEEFFRWGLEAEPRRQVDEVMKSFLEYRLEWGLRTDRYMNQLENYIELYA